VPEMTGTKGNRRQYLKKKIGDLKLTPGVLLRTDHRHELNFLIPITLLDMTTITVIDHGMSLSVLYLKQFFLFLL
jgi:hypothetical protein